MANPIQASTAEALVLVQQGVINQLTTKINTLETKMGSLTKALADESSCCEISRKRRCSECQMGYCDACIEADLEDNGWAVIRQCTLCCKNWICEGCHHRLEFKPCEHCKRSNYICRGLPDKAVCVSCALDRYKPRCLSGEPEVKYWI